MDISCDRLEVSERKMTQVELGKTFCGLQTYPKLHPAAGRSSAGVSSTRECEFV